MIRLVFLFMVIACFTLFYVVSLNIGSGRALPLAVISLFGVAFICNLFGNLSYYKYIIPFLILLIAAYVFIRLRKEKEYRKYLELFLSPALLVYTILFIYFYINSLNKALINIDDLSTWSSVIKGIVRTGQFYGYEQVVSGYPPFILWSVGIICYILGGFSEQAMLFAISQLIIVFVIPALDGFRFRKEDILKIFISTLTIIAVTLTISIVDGDQLTFAYNCIYLDWVMAVSYAYSFYLIFTFNNRPADYISFGIVSLAFLFTKQLSLPLYLVLLFSFFVKLAMTGSLKLKRILPIMLMMTVFYIGWNLLYSGYAGKNLLTDSYKAVAVVLNGFTSEENITILKDFVNAVFTRKIVLHPIGLSYVVFNTLLLAVTLLWVWLKDRNKANYFESVFVYLGSFGYALVLVMSYIGKLQDGYSLPLFSRYMQTYTCAYLILAVMLYLSLDLNSRKRIVLFIAVCLFIEPASLPFINVFHEVSYHKTERDLIETFVHDEYKGENVIVIGQNEMAYKGAAASIFIDNCYYAGVDSITFSEYMFCPVDVLENYLQYFEYLLITDYDDYFAENYWYKMTDLPLYNSTLYRITKTDEGIGFEYVYIWDN